MRDNCAIRNCICDSLKMCIIAGCAIVARYAIVAGCAICDGICDSLKVCIIAGCAVCAIFVGRKTGTSGCVIFAGFVG